jgi:hypothetical protein
MMIVFEDQGSFRILLLEGRPAQATRGVFSNTRQCCWSRFLLEKLRKRATAEMKERRVPPENFMAKYFRSAKKHSSMASAEDKMISAEIAFLKMKEVISQKLCKRYFSSKVKKKKSKSQKWPSNFSREIRLKGGKQKYANVFWSIIKHIKHHKTLRIRRAAGPISASLGDKNWQ